MPGAAALQRGVAVAESILESHKAANNGVLPQTVSVNLWGLDAIKTKVNPQLPVHILYAGCSALVFAGTQVIWAAVDV